MNKFVKIALAGSLAAGLGVSAALANTTEITIDAMVEDYQGLYIETTADQVVSDDHVDQRIGGQMATLNFGAVDALGVAGGTVTSMDHTVPVGTVEKALLVGGVLQDLDYDGSVLASTDGALYYIDSQTTGYQLRYLTNTSEDLGIYVEVENGVGGNALSALVSFSDDEDYTVNVSEPNIIAPNAAPAAIGSLLSNNGAGDVKHLDLGIFVPRNQESGQTSTNIQFTGSVVP
jgi:hypothetical protein